ncbi:hypothetical protein DFH09DRAFT_476940 [Mycena vulgaris]|nr:hypothetical protein DFH09DRAFT_476940 [Mycena vulgaris]
MDLRVHRLGRTQEKVVARRLNVAELEMMRPLAMMAAWRHEGLDQILLATALQRVWASSRIFALALLFSLFFSFTFFLSHPSIHPSPSLLRLSYPPSSPRRRCQRDRESHVTTSHTTTVSPRSPHSLIAALIPPRGSLVGVLSTAARDSLGRGRHGGGVGGAGVWSLILDVELPTSFAQLLTLRGGVARVYSALRPVTR